MSPQHIDPEQAVQIHLDVKSQKSIGIHWGTFAMAYEVNKSYDLPYLINKDGYFSFLF